MNPEELAMMEQQGQPMEQPIPQEVPPTDDGELQNPELAPEQMEMMGQDQGMSVEQLIGGGESMPNWMDLQGGMQEEQIQEPQVTDVLNEVVMTYLDYVMGIKNDQQLDEQVRSKIMAEQASALSSLVPLLTNSGEMEMAKMRHEMDLKYQEHEMDMQIKQQELEMKKEEGQLKLQMQSEQNQMKLQQQNEQHQTKLVQGQESHETKLQQQKQAAQSKPTSNPSNN